MKRFYFVILISALAAGCSSQKQLVKIEPENTSDDSVSYELIITEPGFENWFATNRKPTWYYDENYYRQHNMLMTTEWNIRVTTFNHQEPYDFLINYKPDIHYGIDLDYKLYWYFKFMENKYNISLLITDKQ